MAGERPASTAFIHATAVERHHETSAQATVRVIADTLTEILRTARATSSTPADAARSRARQFIRNGHH